MEIEQGTSGCSFWLAEETYSLGNSNIYSADVFKFLLLLASFASEYMDMGEFKKDRNSIDENGKNIEPCYFNSSIYYGGQEVYSPTSQKNTVSICCVNWAFKLDYGNSLSFSLVLIVQERRRKIRFKWKRLSQRLQRKLVAG